MRKSTLLIMAVTIAAIITTSVFALPKQAFAIIPSLGNQVSGNHQNGIYAVFQQPPQAVQGAAGGGQVLAGKILSGDLQGHTIPLTPLTKSLTPGLCQCFASVGGCHNGPHPCTGAKEAG